MSWAYAQQYDAKSSYASERPALGRPHTQPLGSVSSRLGAERQERRRHRHSAFRLAVSTVALTVPDPMRTIPLRSRGAQTPRSPTPARPSTAHTTPRTHPCGAKNTTPTPPRLAHSFRTRGTWPLQPLLRPPPHHPPRAHHHTANRQPPTSHSKPPRRRARRRALTPPAQTHAAPAHHTHTPHRARPPSAPPPRPVRPTDPRPPPARVVRHAAVNRGAATSRAPPAPYAHPSPPRAP